MIAEISIALTLAMSGYLLLHACAGKVEASARLWMSIPVGAAVYMVVALISLLALNRVDPMLALIVTGGVGLAAGVIGSGRGRWNRSELIRLGVLLAGACALVVLNRVIHLARLTEDSMQYLYLSVEFRVDGGLATLPRLYLLARHFGFPAMHSLSIATDQMYLPSLGTLFGMCVMGFFVWFLWAHTKARPLRTWLVVAGVIFVLASNRFLYAWFYINAHIQVAAYILMAVTAGWLTVRRREPQWALIAGGAFAALLLLRPDSSLFVAIMLVVLASMGLDRRSAWLVAAPPLVVSLAWHGGILLRYSEHAGVFSLSSPVIASIVATVGAAVAVASTRLRVMRKLTPHYDKILLAGLAVGLAFGVIADPQIMIDSLRSTVINSASGFWYITWWVVTALGITALFVHRIPDGRLWTSTLIGFGILYWLLGYFRGGGWRVGPGDSGVRILIHLIPVAVAFLVLVADSILGGRESVARADSSDHEARHLSASH